MMGFRMLGRTIKHLGYLLLLLLLSTVLVLGSTRERIVDFHSQIQVFEDGHLIVIETIKVIATGDAIKRGIYRDFPTRYRNSVGKNIRVGFEVVSVLRNGQPEAYHIESVSNGTRVCMGKKEVVIPPGPHTYALTYRTDRQLGFSKTTTNCIGTSPATIGSFPSIGPGRR